MLSETSFIFVLILLSCSCQRFHAAGPRHSHLLCHPVYSPLFCLSPCKYICSFGASGGNFGSLPSCTAPSPAHRPLQGCSLHPQQQPSSCSTQKGSCPKSLPQFVSVILAVNARGRVQSVCCINRVGELSVGNVSKSSFSSDCFVLERLCRISPELFVLGIKGEKKKLHSLTQYFLLLSRG